MNISLRQLRAFLGVADSGNFTRTAQHLHLSQAGLSATIRELESQLNTRLFERTTRAVVLTEAGRAFLPTATQVERELTAAALRLRDMGRQDIATLKVAFTPLMAANLVPEVLHRFLEAHPTVETEIITANPMEIQQLAESGEIDAAFGAFFSKVSGLRRKAIIPSRLVMVVASGTPVPTQADAAGVPEISWEALSEQPLVCLTQDSPIQQLAERELSKYKVDVNRRIVVQHLDTAIGMAEKGFGMAIIPSFAQSACLRYKVDCYTITPVVGFDYYYVARSGVPVSPTLAAFVATFTKVAR